MQTKLNQHPAELKPQFESSICNICGQCIECNKYIECNECLTTSNISSLINSYKLQLYNKDKIIMNYTKQISEQNKKFELLENSLKLKENQINNLEKALKEFKFNFENQKKENMRNNELIDNYKNQIENQIHQSEHNQTIYDNNFSTMSNKLEENKNKINELEMINIKLNDDVNKLKKELCSKNEIIENKNIMNKKLSNDNKNMNLINNKLNEAENNIKILTKENITLKKYNKELVQDNQNLNQKLNQISKDNNLKENNFNLELHNINSKLNEVEQEFKISGEQLEKYKQEKEYLIQNHENFNNFVNEKLNEMNEYIIKLFNADISELNNELRKLDSMNDNKYNTSSSNIKYELVENGILEIIKNIIKYIINMMEKNDKFMNEYNLISRDKDILKSHTSEIMNELNEYKQNKNEMENINKEIAYNYEKLKDSYTKLYNDYNSFTNSNAKYANNIQQCFLDLIEKINKILGIKKYENDENPLDEILKQRIEELIKEYNLMILKIKENEKKDEITYKKILEMESLLEESHKIGKDFEQENNELKQEIERLNYRYNLLKASIDTVENKINSEI